MVRVNIPGCVKESPEFIFSINNALIAYNRTTVSRIENVPSPVTGLCYSRHHDKIFVKDFDDHVFNLENPSEEYKAGRGSMVCIDELVLSAQGNNVIDILTGKTALKVSKDCNTHGVIIHRGEIYVKALCKPVGRNFYWALLSKKSKETRVDNVKNLATLVSTDDTIYHMDVSRQGLITVTDVFLGNVFHIPFHKDYETVKGPAAFTVQSNEIYALYPSHRIFEIVIAEKQIYSLPDLLEQFRVPNAQCEIIALPKGRLEQKQNPPQIIISQDKTTNQTEKGILLQDICKIISEHKTH